MMLYLSQSINKSVNCLLNKSNLLLVGNKSTFVTTTKLSKRDDRRAMIRSLPKKDEGSQGEKSHDIDYGGFHNICEFPDTNTPNRLFDSIPFKDLPVIHIKTTKNNTIINLCKSSGESVVRRSCGVEGFKNCRKGTNVAAQATALTISRKILNMGYKTVRLCIKGLGPGRMSSVKGLQMGGINIISITDTTPISEFPRARPPVARRL